MDEKEMLKLFISYLSLKYPDKDINEVIKTLQETPGQDGETALEDELKEFQQALSDLQSQNAIKSARNGAKLNYFKLLHGQCPEGYVLGYYEKGGCLRCMKLKCGNKVKKSTKYFK